MITFVIQLVFVMNLEQMNSLYTSLKEPELYDRYITNFHIEPCLNNLSGALITTLGYSVESRPIYSLNYGTGPTKVLMWSQMHGNESTTTKALFDVFNLFESNHDISKPILKACTLVIIPILNPDGAARYSRLNANGIDLNRDAQALSQPESRILRQVYSDFKPNYCFNLHGQRTIFGSGSSGVSATLSFLSPSQDQKRSITENRKSAMAIISEISACLQTELPQGIGRYDDSFNLNCVGDTFQSFGVPTLLYEAGHYPNDYSREEVRRFAFLALVKGLQVISTKVNSVMYNTYFKIPENSKCFFDVIIRNAKVYENQDALYDVAIQYKERLETEGITFLPIVEVISDLKDFFGHREFDAKGALLKTMDNFELKTGNEIDFVLMNNEKITLIP